MIPETNYNEEKEMLTKEGLLEEPLFKKIVDRFESNNEELDETLNAITNRISYINNTLFPGKEEVAVPSKKNDDIKCFNDTILSQLHRYNNLVKKANRINDALYKLVG